MSPFATSVGTTRTAEVVFTHVEKSETEDAVNLRVTDVEDCRCSERMLLVVGHETERRMFFLNRNFTDWLGMRFCGSVASEAVADSVDGFEEFATLAEFLSEGFDVDVNGAFHGGGILSTGKIEKF